MFRRCARRFCAPAERAVEEYDVLIVGGGPAGLSAAIRLKQLAGGRENFRVAVVEKGSAVGSHTLSGACIETHALDELLPKWREDGCPITQKVSHDNFYYLTAKKHYKSPLIPPTLHNEKNYIVSLGAVTQWLGTQAEGLGVDLFPGFAAALPVLDDTCRLVGMQLGDAGITKAGEIGPNYAPGMILKAKQTILAEGCRGSITKKVEKMYKLRPEGCHQSYGLGVKEVWEVPKENFRAGEITHTIGWPLSKSEGHDNTYGGSFMYHFGDNLVAVGFVTGLDYTNPHTRPYMEFQKWKTHPLISAKLQGGTPLSYGARTLVEGGLSSLPKLTFPGGCLVGDCAGFLNLPKMKGTHAAMKSGMLAAESIWEEFYAKSSDATPEYGEELRGYRAAFEKSWLYKELYMVRNVRQMFAMNFTAGVLYTGLTTLLTKGMEPWTLAHKHADHETLKLADRCRPIPYPKPDGKLTFDLLTNHSRSGTAHAADQPAHLKIIKSGVPVAVNLRKFGGPEGKYCPAGVYEFVEKDGEPELVINAQNCLHCKACDIKDPTQNINWTVPEGGGGPNYNAAM